MNRIWIIFCLLVAAVFLTGALLIPAHLRALDAKVVEMAGSRSGTIVEDGLSFIGREKIGPAAQILHAAETEDVPGREVLERTIAQFSRANPSLVPWGGSDPLVEKIVLPASTVPRPIVDWLTQRTVRERVLTFLGNSRRPGVRQLLLNRTLTNTTHFPPVQSSSGQALDAAILTTALLLQSDHFSSGLRDAVESLALTANRGGDPGELELLYMDVLTLGKRLDWVALTEIVRRLDRIATLRRLAETFRTREEQVATIYTAAVVGPDAHALAQYLESFPETGINDVAFAIRSGPGALEMLVKSGQRVHYPGLRRTVTSYDPFGAYFYWILPTARTAHNLALVLKYLLILVGSFFLARIVGFVAGSTHFWGGMRFGADVVMALAMAFVLVLFSEPFTGLPSQTSDFSVRVNIPMANLSGATLPPAAGTFMNQNVLFAMLIFFVLQALIYVWCLSKIGEIRRQDLPASMKLKLIDNEDHLFDAGLYLGFVGTIISFIMVSVGVVKPSLMAAYSSTSFGIIFVSVLKIFHVRPLRRKLLLEGNDIHVP